MRDLLDSTTKRRLKILEQLSKTAEWISSTHLAEENNASLRTINTDIRYLKDQWSPFLIMETSKKNGVRLTTPPTSHIRTIYTNVLKENETFQFLEHIFFQPFRSLEEWGAELFISESSLYRIAAQLKDSLKRFGVQLDKRSCHIIGEKESYARYFYTTYFREVYSIHEWPFSFNREKMIHFAENIFNSRKKMTNDTQLIYMAVFIAVSLTRFSQKDRIEQTISLSNDDYHHFKEKFGSEINQLITPLKIDFTDELVADLYQTIHLFDLDEEKTQMIQPIQEHIQRLQSTLGIDLDTQHFNKIVNTYFQIYNHQKVYPFKSYILFNQMNYNGRSIQQNFPNFSAIALKELKNLEAETGFSWYSFHKYELLYWLMVHWPDLPSQLDKKKGKAKVLVLSDHGIDQTELLADMIRLNFSTKATVTAYKNSVLFLLDEKDPIFEKYDVFVSTFYGPFFPPDKTIIVDSIPSNVNWGNLRKTINEIHNSKWI